MTATGPGNFYWLASYPKSGNTWVRLFLANLLHATTEPVNINAISLGAMASDRKWIQSAFDFGLDELTHDELDRLRPAAYNWLSEHKDKPSYHKIHDAYLPVAKETPLIPLSATRGVLYLIRNPLDIVISYAHHLNQSIDWTIMAMGNAKFTMCGSIEKQENQLRQRILDWSGHVHSWLTAPRLPRLVIRYEDLLNQPIKHFQRITNFLAPAATHSDILRAAEASSFARLTAQESRTPFIEKPPHAQQFFRQGKAGSWQHTLTRAQVAALIRDHGDMMKLCGYLDDQGNPIIDHHEVAL